MTTRWLPSGDWRTARSAAEGIADAIETDLRDGRLTPGDLLPTHRNLARKLGLSVGTITRAYDHARRRGLVRGEVGRGTVLIDPTLATATGALTITDAATGRVPDEPVDLSRNLMNHPLPADLRREVLEVWRDIGYTDLAARVPAAGARVDRLAGAAWVGADSADDVAVAGGGQQAIVAALLALTSPGDVIACEPLTYPGLRHAAAALGRELFPLDADAGGITPTSLRRAIREVKPRAVWVSATVQNPTTTVMPSGRREEIAGISRRHHLPIIEDDAYHFLIPDNARIPALATLAGAGSIRIVSLAKSVLAGLRIAYLVADPATVDRLATALAQTAWMPPPATSAVATRLIHENVAARIAAARREELATRVFLARQRLGHAMRCDPDASPHVWVTLPAELPADAVTFELHQQGILVTPASQFAVRTTLATSTAIRVSLAAEPDSHRLATALDTVGGFIRRRVVRPPAVESH